MWARASRVEFKSSACALLVVRCFSPFSHFRSLPTALIVSVCKRIYSEVYVYSLLAFATPRNLAYKSTMAVSAFRTWIAYQRAFALAVSIRRLTKTFPDAEKYRLTDQIIRSSRSICANLAEAFGRRQYPKHYKSKLGDCVTENFETQVWLDFALEEGYLSEDHYYRYIEASENLGRLLSYMGRNHRQYAKPRNGQE